MQQTEKYKLNLIESSDPFLPEGLNQNTQKIEDVLSQALSAHEAKVDAQTAAHGAAIAAIQRDLGIHGHNARLVYGTYTGNGLYGEAHPTVFTFDFYPVVLMMGFLSQTPGVMVRGVTGFSYGSVQSGPVVTWGERTISLYNDRYAASQFNDRGSEYPYLAIGYDPEQ